jgi:hypothetical protein
MDTTYRVRVLGDEDPNNIGQEAATEHMAKMVCASHLDRSRRLVIEQSIGATTITTDV